MKRKKKKKLPPIALRAFGPGSYPKQCHPLLSVPPPLAGGGCGRLGYFSAGSCFQACNLWALFNFSSQLGCLQYSKTSPRPASARCSWCLDTSSIKTPFPGWVSIPSSFVTLFIFYIMSYLLLKTMGCFSGCLMSSASHQKSFCEICSVFNCSFDEFVGEKVVSPAQSSTILASPLRNQLYIFNNQNDVHILK